MPLRIDTANTVATPVSTEGVMVTTGTPVGSPANVTGVPTNLPANSQGLAVRASGSVQLGTGATGATVRVRQGAGIAGTQVGTAEPVAGAAGTSVPFSIEVLDNTPYAMQNGAGVQYSATIIQTGAPTGAGSVNVVNCAFDVATP